MSDVERRMQFKPVVIMLHELKKEIIFANQIIAEAFLEKIEIEFNMASPGKWEQLEEGDDYDMYEVPVYHNSDSAYALEVMGADRTLLEAMYDNVSKRKDEEDEDSPPPIYGQIITDAVIEV
jgi:hypothetical protein